MADLPCLSPTHQHCVSDYMEQVKTMIQQIIGDGCDLQSRWRCVLLSINRSLEYKQLSVQRLEAGENAAVAARKRNPAHFALLKVMN